MSSFVNNKPLALVLKSNNYNNIYQYDFKEISNEYSVVVKALSQNFLWREAIRETAEERKGSIQLLCVLTHGNNSSLFAEKTISLSLRAATKRK